MRPGHLLLICGAAILLCGSLLNRAGAESPDEVLKSLGLRKIGQFYVLPEETAVTKKYRDVDAARKKAIEAQQKAVAAEKKIEEKQKLILDYMEKRRLLRGQLESTKNVDAHNRIVNMLEELTDRMILLEKSDKEEKDAVAARGAAATASEQYIESLMQMRKSFGQLAEKYEHLAENNQAQEAIDELNKDNPKLVKLGPSGSFALLERNLKRLEATVLSDTISLRHGDGDLWYVTVTINGRHAQEMAIDTGASVLSLPYKVAEASGLTPSVSDPTVKLSLADGRTIEAKQVFAPTIRVGRFVIEHVECAVMPADMPNAQPLLGLSYLKHFTIKIDNERGKLLMSKIETGEKTAGRRVAGRPSRSKPTAEPRDKGGDKPEAAAGTLESSDTPATDATKDVAQQIVAMLKLDGHTMQSEMTLQSPQGDPVNFIPGKEIEVEKLRKQFGDPDEMTKLPLRQKNGGEEKIFNWKLWAWGKARVIVDEGGKTRYYALMKE